MGYYTLAVKRSLRIKFFGRLDTGGPFSRSKNTAVVCGGRLKPKCCPAKRTPNRLRNLS